MGLFGNIVKTAVNVATLPLAVVKDVATCGGVMNDENPDQRASETYPGKKLQKIKDEAGE